jgi:hypothetical protein
MQNYEQRDLKLCISYCMEYTFLFLLVMDKLSEMNAGISCACVGLVVFVLLAARLC